MPINRAEKILFVHIPRTGGTSLENALEIHGDWATENREIMFGINDYDRYLQHLTFDELVNKLEVDLDEYYKFTVIREPLNKMLSEYRWFGRGSFQSFLENVRSALRLRDWHKDDVHFRPQSEFISSELDDVYLFQNLGSVFGFLSGYYSHSIITRYDNTSRGNFNKEKFIKKHEQGVELLKDLYQKDFQFYREVLKSKSS